MSLPCGRLQDGRVEIRIVLDHLEPLEGRVGVVSVSPAGVDAELGQDTPFTGWLGLLAALYRLTASDDN